MGCLGREEPGLLIRSGTCETHHGNSRYGLEGPVISLLMETESFPGEGRFWNVPMIWKITLYNTHLQEIACKP